MGRNKKGFNWKARQVVKTEVIQTGEVPVEVESNKISKYDESNAFVLPSEKRKTKVVKEKLKNQRILSKRQRKKLEKIVETKKKKANRAELLEALAQVQVSSKDLELMTSLTSIQTKGVKRSINDSELVSKVVLDESGESKKISSIAGSKKRQKYQDEDQLENDSEAVDSCNIIGLEVDEESESDSDSSEDEDPETIGTKSESEGEKEDTESKEKSEVEVELKPEAKCEEKPQASTDDVQKEVVQEQKKIPSKPAVFVPVFRTPEIQAARLNLPITSEEQVIVEAINENDVVVLAGETGSGKTTQVPQFLYEAGYATNDRMIGVTEPRRVAATSMAQRVAHEMNLSDGQVSYQIRFEGNVGEETRIKFMTDGVLLKEVQKDFLLLKYSVIIIDEAHERSVYSDILLGLLSRIVALRRKRGNPLKLIIMSATMRVEDFTSNPRLFKVPPPLIKVEARQFPVTVHFNKKTELHDYISEAYKKVRKIHLQLPDGGILVFLTGQQEVNALCRKLRHAFPGNQSERQNKDNPKSEQATTSGAQKGQKDGKQTIEMDSDVDDDMEEVMSKIKRKQQGIKKQKKDIVSRPQVNLDHYSALPLQEVEQDDDDAEFEDLNSAGESDEDDSEMSALAHSKQAPPLWVLPLYSLLPSHRQQKVFQPPPEGYRLCVVATNVAETSLTIPGIRYVVDTGRVKTKFYDKITGVSSFNVTWTSQAAANQRAGRAGRTGPGHCYRLYSSACFNDEFEKFCLPDIARRPIDDLVLQMKAMDIEKVVHFPFPTPPDAAQLCAAERRLLLLGALEPPPRNVRLQQSQELQWTSKITPLGRAMAAYPVAPRYAKMLLLSQQHDLMPLTITLVAALSVQELLLDRPIENANAGETQQKWVNQRRSWAGVGHSLLLGDSMVLLRAVGAAEYAGASEEFCASHGVRTKALREVRKLRVQLTNESNLIVPAGSSVAVDPHMSPPTDVQAKLLRQILLAGLPDHVARRIPVEEIKEDEDKRKFKYAYRCPDMEDPVFVHPNSILRHSRPEWIVYQDIYENQNKIYLRGITAIEPEWLPIFSPSQCTFSAPLEKPAPRYDPARGQVLCHMNVTFGRSGWLLPLMELEYPAGLDKFKFFAQFLLDGSVCTPLAKFANILLSPPSTMVKTWARLQPRTQILLQELTNRGVDNLESLLSTWQSDPRYLLSAYQSWLPASLHDQVATMWPPV